MKARTKQKRWLLIALLFGLLTAAGLTLTHHRRIPMITEGKYTAPTHSVLGQPPTAFVASMAGDDTTPARGGNAYSNSWKAAFADHSSESSNETPAPNTSHAAVYGGSNHAPGDLGGASNATQPRRNPPATSAGDRLPQNGAGELVYNAYVPLGCELPAGCGGVSGSGGSVSRQPSGTSGGTPFLRDSGSDTPGASNPPPGNTRNSDPPGSGPQNPPAAAPELDPAMLAGAVTLLLGSLAVLLGRRVRATR
ncbi:MAG: hypothetical protein ACYDAE_05160 [Steroidobacteraceae bacterium]